MDIEGPFKISVLDDPNQSGWELHLDFSTAFRALEQDRQGEQFAEYLRTLGNAISERDDSDKDFSGMLIVQQIAEQLHPHIVSGEIPLSETLVIEIAQQQGISIQDLMSGNG